MSYPYPQRQITRYPAQRGFGATTGTTIYPIPTRAEFDEQDYLNRYSDVQAAVSTHAFNSGFDHFIRYGYSEGRSYRNAVSGNSYPMQAPPAPVSTADSTPTPQPPVNSPPIVAQPTTNPLSGLFSSKITLPVVGEVPIVGAAIAAFVLFSMFGGDGRK